MAPTLFRGVADYVADMIQSIQQGGSKLTDFNQGSTTRTLFEAFATGLSLQSLVADQLRQDMFLATAGGTALDDKAADFQVVRNPAVQATGTVRVTQQTPGQTIFIPAGFGQLSTISTGPTNPPISVLTTSDGTLPQGTAYIDIPATAVLGGAAGNLGGGTLLVPSTPVTGVVNNGGWQVTPGTGFTGGVDAETDAAFRARIPLAIQGRVTGTKAAFLAAALGVPGVLGASVVPAGTFDGSITVPAGTVEVFYSGSAGLLTAVTSACSNAASLNQTIVTAQATSDRIIVNTAISALKGTDTVALTAAVLAAAQGVVSSVIPGGTLYQSSIIQAIRNTPGVTTINVPATDFRRSSQAPGTANDVVETPNSAPNLANADFTATVTLL